MSFYKEKLEKYSKVDVSLEALEATKAKILAAMRKKYNDLVEEMKWDKLESTWGGLSFLTDETLLSVIHLEKELNFISFLGTQDFYTYYKNMEIFNLSNYDNKLYEKKKELRDTVAKIQKKKERKGLPGKLTTAFSSGKEEKCKEELQSLTPYLLEVDGALAELKKMSDEELTRYIVGRFEVDGKFEFDLQEFKEYIDKLLKKKVAEAQPGNE